MIVARWLVRLEIPILTAIYVYFVISDQVPLAAFGLLLLIWLARWWTTKRLTLTTPFDLPILLLLAWLPLSLSVSIYTWQSLPKVYGVILGVTFFYAIVNTIQSRRDLSWAVFWLVVVCAAISFAGLVGTDWAQNKIISASFIYDRLPRFIQGIPRSIAGGFARNGVGGTLTFVVPLLASLSLARIKWDADERRPTRTNSLFQRSSAWLWRSAPQSVRVQFKFIVMAAFLLAIGTLALTQSRGGLLGAAVGLLGVAIWRERRFAWLLVIGAIGLAVLVATGYGNALVNFVLQMDARSGTLASRMEVWQRGLMMVQDYPFTGIGIGTYNSIAHLLYPFFIAAPDEVVAHAHNNLLEVAVDVGIPGLIAYIALLTGFVVAATRAYRATIDTGVRALIVGLGLGMLAHQVFGLTDAFILGTKPGVLLWVFFAFTMVIYRQQTTDGGPPFESVGGPRSAV
ncbi:MAG: O-antigen ligase family protein [Chloroflexi bacterium]|nr:O-antigen ligase family protein [Chloroflexota bacterium]